VPKQGSEFDLPLSVAIIAMGTSANPIVQGTTPGLSTNKRGYFRQRKKTQAHDVKRPVRGSDIVTGRDGDSRGDTARGEIDS